MQESCQVLVDVRGDEGAYNVTYNDYLKVIAKTYPANYKVIHRLFTSCA